MGRIYFVWCGAKFEVAIVFAVTGGCESSRWGRNIIRVNVNVEYSDFLKEFVGTSILDGFESEEDSDGDSEKSDEDDQKKPK